MKLSTVLVAGAALSAGVDAFDMPPWFANFIAAMEKARPSFTGPPAYQAPPWVPPQAAKPPVAQSSSRTSSAALGLPTGFVNPFAAFTKTASGQNFGNYGGSGSVPTAPAYVSQAPASSSATVSSTVTRPSLSPIVNGTTNGTATSSSSSIAAAPTTNSTLNSNITSCATDAAANPNLPNSATHRCNWAPGFDINTDAETSWPNTGNTVKMTLTITNGTIAPQGDNKIGFLINGQFPGPKIEANWGDNLEITVINQLQNNGTSVHFHGIRMLNNNAADGVGGVTQCPIAPGQSFVYKFQATQYGTGWYHSHFSGQYGDGVLGPLIINGPTSLNYDIDMGPLMVQDYFSLTAPQEYYIATRNGPQTAANYLINGQNAKLDGSGGTRTKFTLTPGKKHKFHIINMSTDAQYKIQMDNHTLIVVAADFVPITPYRTTELSVSVGQRYDVIVEANAAPGNYWLRAMFSAQCAKGLNNGQGSVANGIISYSNAPNPNALPTSSMAIAHSDDCADEPASYLKPIVKGAVDSAAFAGATTSLAIQGNRITSNSETIFTWTLGGITEVAEWSNPTLGAAIAGQSFDASEHVVTLSTPNAWVYWVFQNGFDMSHPMHVHGHDFRVLGQGDGTFDAASMTSLLNFANPPRRDTVQLTRSGWVVAAFKTDNPGAWAMHCHMSWHASGGLALQYLERPSDVVSTYSSAVSSSQYTDTCSAWKKYDATSVWKQSDSGLKRRSVDVSDRHAAHLRRHARSFAAAATL